MSDYHPAIDDVQTWNERLAGCGCCSMPSCESPIVTMREACVAINAFTFDAAGIECEGVYDNFAVGRTVIGNNVSGGFGNVANFTLLETNSFEGEPVKDCYASSAPSKTFVCSGTFERYEGAVGSILGVLSDMAGMPDPRWTGPPPAPILPGPSFPMWTITDNRFGGTLTAYRPDTYTTFNNSVYGVSFPNAWVTPPANFGYSNQINCSEMFARHNDAPDSLFFDSPGLRVQYECGECNLPGRGYLSKYRWTVPPCHPGSYYRIEWDEVFFSDAYLEWLNAATMSEDGIEAFDPVSNPPPDMPTITAKTWEWQGVALGDCDFSDPDDYTNRLNQESRKSPWQILFPELVEDPDNENRFYYNGQYELRNVKILCYRSDYGQKFTAVENIFNTADIDQDGILDAEE